MKGKCSEFYLVCLFVYKYMMFCLKVYLFLWLAWLYHLDRIYRYVSCTIEHEFILLNMKQICIQWFFIISLKSIEQKVKNQACLLWGTVVSDQSKIITLLISSWATGNSFSFLCYVVEGYSPAIDWPGINSKLELGVE